MCERPRRFARRSFRINPRVRQEAIYQIAKRRIETRIGI